jgi:hypothetical protein
MRMTVIIKLEAIRRPTPVRIAPPGIIVIRVGVNTGIIVRFIP